MFLGEETTLHRVLRVPSKGEILKTADRGMKRVKYETLVVSGKSGIGRSCVYSRNPPALVFALSSSARGKKMQALPPKVVAPGAGFEPARPEGGTGSPGQPLGPLGHPGSTVPPATEGVFTMCFGVL